MIIKQIVVGLLHTNSYLIIDEETKEAAIIDPGFESEKIINMVEKENCNLKYLMLTHAHFDHAFEAHILKEKYNLQLIGHKNVKDCIEHDEYNQSLNYKKEKLNLPLTDKDLLLNDNEEFNVGNLKFKILYIGGHTVDSSCFYNENEKIVFTGDTLFFETVGRSDFPGGDTEQIVENINSKLFTLPEDTKVLTGHGECTTIGHETVYNEYV